VLLLSKDHPPSHPLCALSAFMLNLSHAAAWCTATLLLILTTRWRWKRRSSTGAKVNSDAYTRQTQGGPHDVLHHGYTGGPHAHRCAVCHSHLCHARDTMLPKAPFFWPQMLQQARGHMLVEKHTIDIKGKGTLQIWSPLQDEHAHTHINACTMQ
jgi:hypothetical protein